MLQIPPLPFPQLERHAPLPTGNMAVFACKPIAKGSELRHSYLPARLLVCSAPKRRAHLHFDCDCTRCADELAVDEESTDYNLSFPRDHALTAEGGAVAAFTMVHWNAHFRLSLCYFILPF